MNFVRHIVLVEQLGQLFECLLMLSGDHSAKLERHLRGTEQYGPLSCTIGKYNSSKSYVTTSSL